MSNNNVLPGDTPFNALNVNTHYDYMYKGIKVKENRFAYKTVLSVVLISVFILSLGIAGVTAAEVNLEKSHLPQKDYFTPGDTIKFYIEITVSENDVVIDINDLEITDELPEGLTYVPGSMRSIPNATTVTEPTILDPYTLVWFWNGLIAAPPEPEPHAIAWFNVTVDNDVSNGVRLVNVVSAEFLEGLAGISDNVDIGFPVLDIDKECPAGPIHEGDPITYTITLTNTGPVPTDEITVIDALTEVGYFGGASASSGVIDDSNPSLLEWSGIIDGVDGDNQVIITIPVLDNPGLISDLVWNTAEYDPIYEGIEYIKTSDSCSIPVIHPSINIEKTCSLSSTLEPADITYTYTVTNTGDTPLFDVIVYDETLDILILGPVTLPVSGTDSDTYTRQNMMADTYTNIATATGIDILEYTVDDEDDATCTIYVAQGGDVVEVYSDQDRIVISTVIVLTLAVLVLYLKKTV